VWFTSGLDRGDKSDNGEIIEKAREIIDGITDEKYKRGIFYSNDGALVTLQQQKGLCRDYANLTTALCRAVGIEARTVIGQTVLNGSKFGHAWNEIKVKDRWISLDTTWDAGRLQNGKFIPSFSRKYFDPPEKVFFSTHQKSQILY